MNDNESKYWEGEITDEEINKQADQGLELLPTIRRRIKIFGKSGKHVGWAEYDEKL